MQKVAGSFRDPSGFLFWSNNTLQRFISKSYFPHYDKLMTSGLYESLTKKNLLIPHVEEKNLWSESQKVITPQLIPFISYPYEWSFSQLKDAALLTLKITKEALQYGMILKDASAYNVQFIGAKPIFIDTLSFEIHKEGSPWIAYKQFCEHFLAPLALMAYKDVRLSSLLKTNLQGIPIDLTAKLLPYKTYFKLPLLLHIHLHAYAQKKYESKPTKTSSTKVSLNQLLGVLDNLKNGIEDCTYSATNTEWAEYYDDDSYNKVAFTDKKRIVEEFLILAQPKTTWDLGANSGEFSRLATAHSNLVLSMDNDPACVEKNYCAAKKNVENKLFPLLIDLMNPSGNLGWAHQERQGLTERPLPDCILALALIHHIAISNNVPLENIAAYFASLTSLLIIEFVPKEDKKVQILLSSRADIFDTYTQESFEKNFSQNFKILSKETIKESKRTLYLMRSLRSEE